MKVAIIGSGVSGLGAAYALKDVHDITIYEKDDRLGGHANTVRIDYEGAPIDVDTGFIVYNQLNYPNLVGLLDALGVQSVETDMSFAFAGDGREWSSNFPRGVFAQKRISPIRASCACWPTSADLIGRRMTTLPRASSMT